MTSLKPRAGLSGAFEISADRTEIVGWVSYEEKRDASQVAVVLGTNLLTTLSITRPPTDPSASDRLRFSWRIPRLLRSSADELSVVDLFNCEALSKTQADTASRLSGLELEDEQDRERTWPNGLAGSLYPGFNELNASLVVEVGGSPSQTYFSLVDPPPQARSDDDAVLLVASAETTWSVHQPLPQTASGGEEVVLRFWLKTAQATSSFSHRQCDIFLTTWNGETFERLRRLRRGRMLRSFSFIDTALLLDADELALAAEKRLFVSVVAQQCSGLAVCVPEIAKPVAAGRFEDGRLEGAFENALELSRVLTVRPDVEPLSSAKPVVRPRSALASAPFTEVIIPVFNGGDTVLRCLRSIRENTDTPYGVLIVNDGSRDYTTIEIERLIADDPRFRMHTRDFNRGYTQSVNEGLKLSSADWVVILNSDTVVPSGWLRRLHRAAASRPDAGLVGALSNAATWQSLPEAKNPDGSWSTNDFVTHLNSKAVQARLDAVSERNYPETPLLNGFCTLISRRVFDEVGLLDEEAFPMGYGEETDLCLRAAAAGFKLLIADDCFVYHEKSVSFGAVARARLTRQGGLELKNKHPGVSIPALEHAMQRNPTVSRLRAQLRNLKSELQN